MSIESKLENSLKNDIYKLSCKLKTFVRENLIQEQENIINTTEIEQSKLPKLYPSNPFRLKILKSKGKEEIL